MEKEITAEFDDVDVEVGEGAIGGFNVFLNDRLIFSKKEGSCCQDRFPRRGEINEIIRHLKS